MLRQRSSVSGVSGGTSMSIKLVSWKQTSAFQVRLTFGSTNMHEFQEVQRGGENNMRWSEEEGCAVLRK
jgi:hypothetical protein